MSLAENLLNSISENNSSNSRIAGSGSDEPHIVVDETRTIRVPDSLKTIAVKGDKDVETVTIDCIRYWDGFDLSTFSVYLNYTLPNGKDGTYVPESITINDNTFSFEWVISRAFTIYSGQITFWIVAKKLNSDGTLNKQWGSFKNSECSIADGGSDEIYDPSKPEDVDLVGQVILSISRAEQAAKEAEEAASVAESFAEMAENGMRGPKGDKGEKGDKGDKGDKGEPGIQGEKGEKGDVGEQGERGYRGFQGLQGEPGPKGEKGDTGSQGPQGEKGPQGEQGPKGPQGEKGEKGDQGNITIDGNTELKFFVGTKEDYEKLSDDVKKSNLFAIITDDPEDGSLIGKINGFLDGSIPVPSAEKATVAEQATMAEQATSDGNGENITQTYVRKDEQKVYNKPFIGYGKEITKGTEISLGLFPDDVDLDKVVGIGIELQIGTRSLFFRLSGGKTNPSTLNSTNGRQEVPFNLSSVTGLDGNEFQIGFMDVILWLASNKNMYLTFEKGGLASYKTSDLSNPAVFELEDGELVLKNICYWFA
jgi:hypothetical protein